MNIQAINFIPRNRLNYNCSPNQNSSRIAFKGTPLTDVFQKRNYLQLFSSIKNDVPKSYLANCFLRANAINEEVYAKISPEELLAVRAQLKPDLIHDAEFFVTVSKIVKGAFDEKYGENQYTFVSIGRSLSAMANCLNFLGIETKHVPLSGCNGTARDVNKTVNTMIEQSGFEKYKNFLEKTLPRNANKRYIFADYASTGKTLEVFEALLNHPKVGLGSKSNRYVGVNNLLEGFINYEDYQYIYRNNVIASFNDELYRQHFDKYSEVKSLNFEELKYLDSALKPENLRENKLIKFCMLDILKNAELKN